jgi:hypothetical protein
MSLIGLLLSILLASAQTYTCATAYNHVHTDIREGQVQVSSWVGCTMVGTINGQAVQLWADSATCPLKAKVPGTFSIRYDFTCKQVLDLSDGALPPYCPSSPTPTPVPSPTPSPTPLPTPTPVVPTSCSISAPASVIIPRNSIGTVSVTLSGALSGTLTAASSSPGQVNVSPSSRLLSGTGMVIGFALRVKKQSAMVTFASPCGGRTVQVTVR